MILTYPDAINLAAATLANAGIEAPRREARLLLAHLLALPARSLPPENATVEAARVHAAVVRRAAREPLAYITGTQGFWTIDLEVSPATLIPRADSETLIEAALALFPNRAAVTRVLDLGTGTGCLLLAALTEFPAAFGIGVDRAPAAAALAARNAARLGLADRTAFLAGHWTDALATRVDLLLCNPPYIETASIPGLMPEVARHEPALALDGGADGLAAYAAVIPALPDLLSPGGAAILELGADQAEATAALAQAAGFTRIFTHHDLGGMQRALVLHGVAERPT
ncbi:MAG: peptide chain release factor N(5)-glutamine methyltransferase [Rhodospirillales bacterium]